MYFLPPDKIFTDYYKALHNFWLMYGSRLIRYGIDYCDAIDFINSHIVGVPAHSTHPYQHFCVQCFSEFVNSED